ncbi:Prefoldin subunit 3 [Globisporangium polare]
MSTESWINDGEHVDSSTGAASDSDWEVRHDETSGAAYFFNTRTGESSWEAPTEESHPAAGHEDATSSLWTEVFDESRDCAYYVNLLTSETRWDPPPGYTAHSVDTSANRGSSAGAKSAENDRAERMTTAEQMEKLNRLLSGDDDDEDANKELHEAQPTVTTTTAAAPPSSSDGANVHEMPWMMFLNESDGVPYYYNHVTGECVWDPPADFVAYHQQRQEEDHHDSHQQEQHVAVESEAEAAQRESARSGIQSTVAMREASIITPEFEEKVRRAIESVSKTPVGSSRVLFVRTPSEKWPEFTTAKSGRDGNERPQRPGSALAGAVSSAREGTVDAAQPTSSRIVTTPGRPRSSRPGSVALNASSRPRTPQPAVISEYGVDADELNAEDLMVTQGNVEEGGGGLSEALQSSKLVESYDPETGTFIHVVEAPPEQQLEPQPDSSQELSVFDDAENDRRFGMALQLRFEEAALGIECLVRCFLARRRVQKKRRHAKEQEEAPQHEEIAPLGQLAASDDNAQPVAETVGRSDTQLRDDVTSKIGDSADHQASSVTTAAQDDATVESDAEAAAPIRRYQTSTLL